MKAQETITANFFVLANYLSHLGLMENHKFHSTHLLQKIPIH